MKNTILLSILLLFLFSCEPDTPTSNQQAQMIVEKDGVSFTITDFTNGMTDEMQAGSKARKLVLRTSVDSGEFTLAIGNWEWQNPPSDGILEKVYDIEFATGIGPNTECQDQTNETYCDGSSGSYVINSEIFIAGTAFSNEDGVITITENDLAKKTVSGSFDFVVKNSFTDSAIVFKGTFENLVYLR